MSLQVAIAYMVAGHFPGSFAEATTRAELVLLGGAAQIAIVATLARLFPSAGSPLPQQVVGASALSPWLTPIIVRAASSLTFLQ